MDLGFCWADGAFFLAVRDFSSFGYLIVFDEEDSVGRRHTANFSLGETVKIVGVSGAPDFSVWAACEGWVFLGDSCDIVDNSVGLCVFF